MDWVRARSPHDFEPVYPDKDAKYRAVREVDLVALEPLVAYPDTVVQNSRPVREAAGTKIDQAYIGSCANGTIDDLELAAQVVAERLDLGGSGLGIGRGGIRNCPGQLLVCARELSLGGLAVGAAAQVERRCLGLLGEPAEALAVPGRQPLPAPVEAVRDLDHDERAGQPFDR
jgi:hypothetical protein